MIRAAMWAQREAERRNASFHKTPLTSRLGSAVDLLDWAGLETTTADAALLYTLTGFGFAVLAARLFCCPSTRRGRSSSSSSSRPRCRLLRCRDFGAHRAGAAVTARARQSRRLAAWPSGIRFPVCRSGRRSRASRSYDPRLHRAARMGAAWCGRILRSVRHEARHRKSRPGGSQLSPPRSLG